MLDATRLNYGPVRPRRTGPPKGPDPECQRADLGIVSVDQHGTVLEESGGNDYSGKVDTKTLTQTDWRSQKSDSERLRHQTNYPDINVACHFE